MKKVLDTKESQMPDELVLAIGLIWGHLNTGQVELADQLVRGCLRVWPGEQHLVLMSAYVAVELSRPLDEATLAMMQKSKCPSWTERVLRRAALAARALAGAFSAAATGARAKAASF